MSAILGLFNIFALIYIFRSVQLSIRIVKEWRQLTAPPFNRYKKHLAEQASFFIAVPIGVFFHEFSHVVATWLSGGKIIEFGYRVFWGYVIPQGDFSPLQDWFISLAGTLGSLIFGLAIWLLLRAHPVKTISYFGLRSFRYQLFFSLVYYPLFTLLGFVGDWRTIYGFDATPLASALTVPFHLGLLLLFWWQDRHGGFEMVGHESAADQASFDVLATDVGSTPFDQPRQLHYIDALRRGGAINKARYQLNTFIKHNPNSGEGYLQLAALEIAEKSQASPKAIKHLQRALDLGLSNHAALAFAHQMMGKYFLELGNAENAAAHLSQAIDSSRQSQVDSRQLAQLYHWRSQAYRRQRKFELAYADVVYAGELAKSIGENRLMTFYQNELHLLEQHAGYKIKITDRSPFVEGGDV